MLNTRRQHAIYLAVINASIDKFPLSTHCTEMTYKTSNNSQKYSHPTKEWKINDRDM